MNPIKKRKADQPKTVSKKAKQQQEEPEESGVKLNDLPELPFEKILGYLSLEDRIKARAVSRRWRKTIDRFRVRSLCFTQLPIGFIEGKARWVSGAFAWNFISSSKFGSFFNAFSQSILCSLKHLRLCDLHLNAADRLAFTAALNSFGNLEELDIIRFHYLYYGTRLNCDFELNLPMLNSIQFQALNGIVNLTLDAPRLQKVKVEYSTSLFASLKLNIVHADSVEVLIVDSMWDRNPRKFKNLKYFYNVGYSIDNSTSPLLPGLKQLKEIYLGDYKNITEFFEQKQRYGLTELKIFLYGIQLNGPEDPAIDSIYPDFPKETFSLLAANPARLADEFQFQKILRWSAIESVASASTVIDILKRFTDLEEITVDAAIQDVPRFLDILKNCGNIVKLNFDRHSPVQPQEVFDRLSDHCAVQELSICPATSAALDLGFLSKLGHLTRLSLQRSIDTETVRMALETLKFLSSFQFLHSNKQATIRIGHSKPIEVTLKGRTTEVADLNAAIGLLVNKTLSAKQTAGSAR